MRQYLKASRVAVQEIIAVNCVNSQLTSVRPILARIMVAAPFQKKIKTIINVYVFQRLLARHVSFCLTNVLVFHATTAESVCQAQKVTNANVHLISEEKHVKCR